jgi:hypothetical protein
MHAAALCVIGHEPGLSIDFLARVLGKTILEQAIKRLFSLRDWSMPSRSLRLNESELIRYLVNSIRKSGLSDDRKENSSPALAYGIPKIALIPNKSCAFEPPAKSGTPLDPSLVWTES